MPVLTTEQVASKVERAAKKLATLDDDSDPIRRRSARKVLKRAQRKHRRLARAAERRAGKSSESKES